MQVMLMQTKLKSSENHQHSYEKNFMQNWTPLGIGMGDHIKPNILEALSLIYLTDTKWKD